MVNEYAVCNSLTISLLFLAVSNCHKDGMMCDASEDINFVWKKMPGPERLRHARIDSVTDICCSSKFSAYHFLKMF